MKFYHGTSAEAAEKILVDGFGCNEETVWNCSDNGSTYFWAHAVDRIEAVSYTHLRGGKRLPKRRTAWV